MVDYNARKNEIFHILAQSKKQKVTISKEKAQELIFNFGKIDHINDRCLPFKQAKQCALIAVDEIILEVEYLDEDSEIFWRQVKQEIEKL